MAQDTTEEAFQPQRPCLVTAFTPWTPESVKSISLLMWLSLVPSAERVIPFESVRVLHHRSADLPVSTSLLLVVGSAFWLPPSLCHFMGLDVRLPAAMLSVAVWSCSSQL